MLFMSTLRPCNAGLALAFCVVKAACMSRFLPLIEVPGIMFGIAAFFVHVAQVVPPSMLVCTVNVVLSGVVSFHSISEDPAKPSEVKLILLVVHVPDIDAIIPKDWK